MRSDSTIAQLHDTLQIAFGWTNEHLHQFLIRGKPYGVWKPGGISFCDNPHQVRLCDFHFRCKERWTYEYDLTDWWQHEIRLEQILPLDPAKRYPICVVGKRRAPLEDCGGPWAFMAFRDEHSLFEVTAQFAQLLLDHRDELDDYQDELRRLGYWIVCEHFDRQAVTQEKRSWSPVAALFSERSTPELLCLEVRWASLMSYGLTVGLLGDLLPMEHHQKLARTLHEFDHYIRSNRSSIPNYGDRYRIEEAISSAVAESSVNQIVSRRFVKKQQMRWTRQGAHLLLQVRTRVLDDTIRTTFQRWYPGMRTDETKGEPTLAAS